jgi:predicted TIM-barrel fold metal-dependent hydrolase
MSGAQPMVEHGGNAHCAHVPHLVDGWIDVHAHFAPPRSAAQRDAIWSHLQADNWAGCQPPEWTLDERLAYMDRVGIAMQMLSMVGHNAEAAHAANAYGAQLRDRHPARFGLLAGLPTDAADAALAELAHAERLAADGFAVYCQYNGVFLSDARLEPLWRELDRRAAVVFVHPDHAVPGQFGRPGVLMDVAYQTASVVADMLYAGIFRCYPGIRFVLAHCGGALPALSGRLLLLGTQPWVANPQQLSQEEMRRQLAALYLDTAMAGHAPSLSAGIAMTSREHLVYGSDCGAPCTVDATAIANIRAMLAFKGLDARQIAQIGRNALALFPAAAARMRTIPGAAR